MKLLVLLPRNLTKSIGTLSSNLRFNPEVVSTQSYSKNTKTARVKLPNEGKQQAKWIPARKIEMVDNKLVDAKFLQRKVVDPVWLMEEYAPKSYDIEDAIRFHIEFAQETMLNNLSGFLYGRFHLDMNSNKKGKFMDDIKGSVYFPNYFADGIQKEVVAVCKTETEIAAAKEAGALFAGYEDVLKKLEKNEISEQSYDYLVCTPDVFADLVLIKKKINKDKFPSPKTNTVGEDIGKLVKELHFSKSFQSVRVSDELGLLKIKIGPLSFGVEKLEENLRSLVEKLKQSKKSDRDTFITDCVLYAAPSTEKFKVDLSRYNKKLEAVEEAQAESS